jgi:SAM-dependent methyltransferase
VEFLEGSTQHLKRLMHIAIGLTILTISIYLSRRHSSKNLPSSPSNLGPRVPTYDKAAAHYDSAFTNTLLGVLLRSKVWRVLQSRFPKGSKVIELNCGTGSDAKFLSECGVKVHATDVSPQMLETTKLKNRDNPNITVSLVDLENVNIMVRH